MFREVKEGKEIKKDRKDRQRHVIFDIPSIIHFTFKCMIGI